MAFRVDNIAVSDKNVMLFCDGKQYIADIEKEKEITNTFNKSRDSNPWNLKTEDGCILNNLFELSGFTVRTQVVTGSNGASVNYKQSHETYYMPNPSEYVGLCQFYGNAYSITNRTECVFTSTYNTTSGNDSGKYESDGSFIRYEMLSSYDNMVDYYIGPNTAFEVDKGIQYFTEYPIGSFYSDFGDNENSESPTIYGDTCPLKYYLNDEYSVESTYIDKNRSKFYLRTYYGIGNTGNSVYLVFKNDKTGTSHISSNNGTYVPTQKYDAFNYIIKNDVKSIGYMSNITTIYSDNSRCMLFASSPYSDFFSYDELRYIGKFSFIKQPKNKNFILYFKNNDDNTSMITFIPKNGLEKSRANKTVTGSIGEESVIELNSSVLIPTEKDGIIVIDDDEVENATSESRASLSYIPFKNSYIGHPDSDATSSLDGTTPLSSFELTWNEKDIVAATAIEERDGHIYRIALLSTDIYSDKKKTSYSAGHYFMRAAYPSYELNVSTVEEYSPYTEVISSVPSSYSTDTGTLWTYVLSSVQTREITSSYELSSFEPSSNYIVENSSVLFDYSSTNIEGKIKLGSYAFVQFDNYGLAKCHVDDIFNDEQFIHMSTAGITNRKAYIKDGAICKDVHFNIISYSKNIQNITSDSIEYIGLNSNSNFVYGLPALYSTYIDAHDGWYNTFSLLPLDSDRDIILEPTFSVDSSYKELEYSCLTSCKYIFDKYIEGSYGVAVRTLDSDGVNHDASIAMVKWNQNNGTYISENDYTIGSTSLGGLHLQYSSICTELFVKGKNTLNGGETDNYTSTVYEYPHPCFGNLATAGTGIHIFDGELSASMKVDDVFMLNGYLIVKNYAVKNMDITITEQIDENIRNSGKVYSHSTGYFPNGGYVITNFFLGKGMNIPSLYNSKLVSSSKVESKTTNLSETIYDYSYLWHIYPEDTIKFYPKSENGVEWMPFYAYKYIDFIKYHNGYYYIGISNSEEKDSTVTGYELIETTDLFTESKCTALKTGMYISDIGFFGDNVAVEYTDASNNYSKETKWFKQGNVSTQTYPMLYFNSSDSETEEISSVNRSVINLVDDADYNEARVQYDNVEVINSINRFNSVVSHKSNIFSVKISELGLDDSPYLTETQKKNIRTWFKNRITTIVDMVKPANTQLFDVFLS